jgi:uncharacterized protein (TIGR02466 family)
MQANYEVLELFPTPVFTTTLPPQYGSITEWFYKQEMVGDNDDKDDPGVDAQNYGERSKNSYILDEPECKDIKTLLLGISKTYGDMLGYNYESYRFGQSWLSYKHPGQQHIQHTHPNSLISGVFYFGSPEPDTPAIKFHKMVGGFNQSSLVPKEVLDKRELKYAWREFNINFSPGLLLLFPSYLHHSVPQNKTNTTRCSLAFNVVPTIGFGEETSLTELKF